MKHTRVSTHIDDKILENLSTGVPFDKVISEIEARCETFKARDSYLPIPIGELLHNWKYIESRSRYISFYVAHSAKRIEDLNWLVANKERFPDLNNSKLFRLIKFKEELLISKK